MRSPTIRSNLHKMPFFCTGW